MSLLYGHLICALLTWVALVTDGSSKLTPREFAKALDADFRIYGFWRMCAWVLLCLTMWWVVWFAWFAEWLDSRR